MDPVTFKSRGTLALQYDTSPTVVDETIRANGFELAQVFPRAQRQNEEKIYVATDGQTVVRYVRDHIVHIDLLTVEAQSGAVVDDLCERFAHRLEFFQGLQLTKLADSQDIAERSFGLRALAATLYGPWIGAVECLRAAFADPRLDVRRIALLASVRMGWRELATVLQDAAEAETDPDLRAELTAVAGYMREVPFKPFVSPW